MPTNCKPLTAAHRPKNIPKQTQLLNGGSEAAQRLGQLATWERAADEALAASQQRAQQAQTRIKELEAQRQDMHDKMQSTQVG